MKSIGVPGRLLVAGTVFAALVACSDADNNAPSGQTQADHEMAMPDEALMARIVADDAEYLVQLGLMRGHLYVGNQLYLLGELAEAVTHMKHPESELYAELVPGLESREAAPFADELQGYAMAVESGERDEVTQARYRTLNAAIARAENRVEDLTAGQAATVVSGLLAHVNEEYSLAVNSAGRLQNAHEYQDSMGFVNVAGDYIARIGTLTDNQAGAQGLEAQLTFLRAVFPSVVPPTTGLTPPETVSDLVVRINTTLGGF